MILLALSALARADDNQLYVAGRGSLAYPANVAGTAIVASIGAGAILAEKNKLGVRFAVLPDPPSIYGVDTPDLAFGPLVDWAFLIRVGENFSLYPCASAGFAMGKSPYDGTNQIMPLFEAGFGADLHFKMSETSQLFFAPELGVAPFALAPYMGVNIGVTFPAGG